MGEESCANCGMLEECGISAEYDREFVRAIGLRCDSWIEWDGRVPLEDGVDDVLYDQAKEE